MKPTKPGFWFYKKVPAKVELFIDGVLVFFQIGTDVMNRVSNTEDSDWGPEIKGDGDE